MYHRKSQILKKLRKHERSARKGPRKLNLKSIRQLCGRGMLAVHQLQTCSSQQQRRLLNLTKRRLPLPSTRFRSPRFQGRQSKFQMGMCTTRSPVRFGGPTLKAP